MALRRVDRRAVAAAKKPENRGYADNGNALYKQAAARWMKNVCGVPGSIRKCRWFTRSAPRPALSILPACFINPGDVAADDHAGLPRVRTHGKYYGGEVHNIPFLERNQFLPDLSSIPATSSSGQGPLVINYPNTHRRSATPEFFAEVVTFAKKHTSW